MDFFLTPTYASSAIQVLGVGIAIVYLLSRKQKSVESRLIMLTLLFWGASAGSLVYYEVTHTHLLISGTGFQDAPLFAGTFWAFVLAFLLFLGSLLYRIGGNNNPIESRVFTGAGILYLVVHYGLYIVNLDDFSKLIQFARMETNIVISVFLWLIIVAVRKIWYLRSSTAPKRVVRLVQMFLISTAAALVFYLSTSYLTIIFVLSAEVRGILPAFCGIIFVASFVIGYLLYGGEKHSLSVTLIGFLMISYVAIFATVLPILRPEVDLRRTFQNPGSPQTLMFSPDSLGGYVLTKSDAEWIEHDGTPFVVQDDAAAGIKTPFLIPFYGAEYDSVWVGTNGSVSFGAELDKDLAYSQGESFYDAIPSAMVMYSDFLLGASDARIFIDESPDRLVITWFNISNYDQHESTYNLQTVLYPDGRVRFNYGEISSIPLMLFSGISPGGPAEPIEFQSELVGLPGQAMFEFHDTRDAYRAYVHPLILPAAMAGGIGLFVVLLLGILFYRAGILVPLDRVLVGLRSVEQGDLDKTVVITERNELGSLADYFNQMTTSLREYRDKMEDLVSKRTADLDRTIIDLKATQAQLVEQDKLASLGALTAGIAHEIKNPLNFVNNFAEVGSELFAELKEAVNNGDKESVHSILGELEQNSEQIAKHGKRADSIVRSMMQHAKGGTSEMEAIVLNSFLEEYANLAWHGMRARDHGFQADVIRNFDSNVESINAMPQELGRVILNLLNNAFDAIRETHEPAVTISTRAVASGVEIVVSDNGPGIPEEIREKVLEPFFTTKATGEGTGLGLSLSYDIVTNGHGGQMSVRESADGGAEFVIRLPA